MEKKKVMIIAESQTLDDAREMYECAKELETRYEVSYMFKHNVKRAFYALDEGHFLEVLNKKGEKKTEKSDSPIVIITLCFSLVSLILSVLAFLGF